MQEINEIPRETLETQLQFVCLILFRNELKEESALAIKSLKEGEVMVLFLWNSILCNFVVGN